ncbi:hypothetical protein KC316_g20029, partial [Hortaea werneckii]
MKGNNAREGPSASHSSIGNVDEPTESVAALSENFGKLAMQKAQEAQEEETIRGQIALAVGNESAALLELRHTVDKGYGLFAAKDIKRGTCIFKEAPLVLITQEASDNPETVLNISQQVSKLPQGQRRAYRLLHTEVDYIDPAAVRIIRNVLARNINHVDTNAIVQRKIDDLAIFKTN